MSNFVFPKDFKWGVAGSAFQMEGGMYEGGKCLNIREVAWLDAKKRGNFQQGEMPQPDSNWLNPESPTKFQDDRSPEVSCDFYHKYPEDISLLGQLGVKMFRFSIAWARIIPTMDAEPNREGIAYYHKMIDCMVQQGIEPFFDLWHSDLPDWVLDNGGIISDDFVSWFSRYAEVCFKEFGDRVKYWSTCNEPYLNAYAAYANGNGAPYMKDLALGFKAAHHMVLAHFEAVRHLRRLWPDAKIGSVHNTGRHYSLSFEERDVVAAERRQASQYLLAEPMIRGEYPKEVLEYAPIRKYIPDSYIEELKEKFVPMDFLGCNYYSACFSRAGEKTSWGTEGFRVDHLPKDAYGFTSYASGLFDLLTDLSDRFPEVELYVTENGYTQRRADVYNMDLTPYQHDEERQRYIREHLRACQRAIRAGANLKGYFYWSVMDCWESSMGYGYPMGLIAVNLDTLERIPRDSFYYYQKVIKHNCVD